MQAGASSSPPVAPAARIAAQFIGPQGCRPERLRREVKRM